MLTNRTKSVTFNEEYLTLILQAIKFAADKHQYQRRKNQELTPYINHPLAVMETLWRVGQVRHVPTLVAAVLHDTIEDTDTTPEEIEFLFGAEVLALVQEVSDDKNLPKGTRKQLQIEHAAHLSAQAKVIKIADKLHNIYDVSHAPPAAWPQERIHDYLEWAEKVVAGLRGVNPALEAEYDRIQALARAQIAVEKE
jgi:GTP diphosphokinase / guanosine-3',5'-bis(diphosphate) 3'-diphosphatase